MKAKNKVMSGLPGRQSALTDEQQTLVTVLHMHLFASTYPPSNDEGFLAVSAVQVSKFAIFRYLKLRSSF